MASLSVTFHVLERHVPSEWEENMEKLLLHLVAGGFILASVFQTVSGEGLFPLFLFESTMGCYVVPLSPNY